MARELGIVLFSVDAINGDRGLHGGEGMTDKQWEETSCLAWLDCGRCCSRSAPLVWTEFFRSPPAGPVAKNRCCWRSGFLVVFVDTPLLEIEARRAANDRNSVHQHIRDAVF